MPADRNGRILDPVERMMEVLFGLIMVMTFTGALSVAESGQAEVRAMLVGALGCNVAWGFIDAVMFLMTCLAERRQARNLVDAIQKAAAPDQAYRAIADALPTVVAGALREDDLERIRGAIKQLPRDGSRVPIATRDLAGALGVFILVVASTLPVVLPFAIVPTTTLALRISNAIALAMLFGLGYAYGGLAGYRPLVVALLMIALGMVLVAITIVLGG